MDIIESLPNDHKIWGDFIVILDFELDRTGGSNQAVTNNKAREVIQQWLNDEILVDVWRVRNQEKGYIHGQGENQYRSVRDWICSLCQTGTGLFETGFVPCVI